MTNPIRTATDRFSQGFNCSQAIFSAFASRSLLTDESALKLSSPFGGGIAQQGQVCGALSGALMALGLQHGSPTPEGNEAVYSLVDKFIKEFKGRHGSILCSELIGHDISTTEGLQAARQDKAFTRRCPNIVEQTATSLTEFLQEI